MMGLTAQQSRAYDVIVGHVRRGLPPSYVELQAELGLSSKASVVRLLNALEERGRIRRMRGRARAIEVVSFAHNVLGNLPDLDTADLRHVLGRVIGLLSDRDGIPETAAMLHRAADRLPRRGN